MNELELLGKKCMDIVSGFEGICTGVTEWLYGCRQFVLQPKAEDGSKKNYGSYFFEKQLEVVDGGISEKAEIPVYDAPKFFGKECRDKVTGAQGICVGRTIFLFSSTQYVIEIPSEDQAKDSRLMWIDEGRMETVQESKRDIDPAAVTGSRPGAVLDASAFPTMMDRCGF